MSQHKSVRYMIAEVSHGLTALLSFQTQALYHLGAHWIAIGKRIRKFSTDSLSVFQKYTWVNGSHLTSIRIYLTDNWSMQTLWHSQSTIWTIPYWNFTWKEKSCSILAFTTTISPRYYWQWKGYQSVFLFHFGVFFFSVYLYSQMFQLNLSYW